MPHRKLDSTLPRYSSAIKASRRGKSPVRGESFPSDHRTGAADHAGGQTGLCPALHMRPDRYPLARHLICVINVVTKRLLKIGLRVLLLQKHRALMEEIYSRHTTSSAD